MAETTTHAVVLNSVAINANNDNLTKIIVYIVFLAKQKSSSKIGRRLYFFLFLRM